MGTVDIVPGVSGGTIALATGIYERLVSAIHNILTLQTATELRTFKWQTLAKRIDILFLLQLGAGIVVGIATMANLIVLALVYAPWYTWAVFFGAVLYSVWIVVKQVRNWSATMVLLTAIGTVVSFGIVSLHSLALPDGLFWLLVSGAIASCAMILPGISGSFLLVLLGKYETILTAVQTGNVTIIALVGIGAGLGLIVFSATLKLLLTHAHDKTFAVLAGLILGSVWVLWPWSSTLEVTEFAISTPAPVIHNVIIAGAILVGMALMYTLNRLTK